MSRSKLQKFAALLTYPNVYENRADYNEPCRLTQGDAVHELRGHWAERHFKNQNPIVLELACGRGEYSLGLARMSPNKNFIGVDIKGARIHQGATIALEENLQNVAFLRTRIELIQTIFAPDEVAEIWITFPDPFLRDSKENRRLTSAPFLERYRPFLRSDGMVHLKTDSFPLYAFTLETLAQDKRCCVLYQNDNIYHSALIDPSLEIQTYYEKMHLAAGKSIKYVQFKVF